MSDRGDEVITIRAASAGDIPGIRAVGAAAWRDTYTGLVPPGYIENGLAQGWAAERFAQDLADPIQRLLVAATKTRIVGVVHAIDREGIGYLWRLYLLREARGGGTGRALWEAALAAFPAPFPRWEASVIVGNPALRFYQRLGFRVLREEPWTAYGHTVPLAYLEWAPTAG